MIGTPCFIVDFSPRVGGSVSHSYLQTEHILATFFVKRKRAEQNPGLGKAADDGRKCRTFSAKIQKDIM